MRKNINEAEWKVRVDLAAMFRLTHMMGWDDTVWNHITARTPGTDHTFFMHRFGLVYEEVKASNLIKVNENDFIEKFIDRVVEEKPEMIVVQDKQNKNVGCISSKRLSEILKK